MSEKQNILIIDDAREMHRLIKLRAKGLSVDFSSAFTTKEGLDAARADRPDLILLDLDLGDVASGFDTCVLLKSQPETMDIPIIFLSADSDSLSKVRGFDLGATDYIVKPFDHAELVARIRAALKTKSLLDLLARHALMDGLSGLHNRRYFDQRLIQEIESNERHHGSISLMLIDLDHFKKINDTLGHPIGDQVIRRFAALIKGCCRKSDIPCRLGGDEFVIIMPGSSMDISRALAERIIRGTFRDACLNDLVEAGVSCSIGLAGSSPMGRHLSPNELFLQADRSLYAAKEQGRNGYASSEPDFYRHQAAA